MKKLLIIICFLSFAIPSFGAVVIEHNTITIGDYVLEVDNAAPDTIYNIYQLTRRGRSYYAIAQEGESIRVPRKYKSKWIGYTLTDQSGNLRDAVINDDVMTFRHSMMVAQNAVTHQYIGVDIGDFIPENRVKRVLVSCYQYEGGIAGFSGMMLGDGVAIIRCRSDNAISFGPPAYNGQVDNYIGLIPVNNTDIYMHSESRATNIHMLQVELITD